MSFWQEYLLKVTDHLSDYLFGLLCGFILGVYLLTSADKRTVREETLKEVAEAQANQTLDSLIEKELKKK